MPKLDYTKKTCKGKYFFEFLQQSQHQFITFPPLKIKNIAENDLIAGQTGFMMQFLSCRYN